VHEEMSQEARLPMNAMKLPHQKQRAEGAAASVLIVGGSYVAHSYE